MNSSRVPPILTAELIAPMRMAHCCQRGVAPTAKLAFDAVEVLVALGFTGIAMAGERAALVIASDFRGIEEMGKSSAIEAISDAASAPKEMLS